MALTLLQIVQTAADEIGLPRPTQIASSADTQVIQLMALANRLGVDLARDFEWRRLVKEHSFTTVNGTQDYSLPADYDRTVSDTQWDRSNHWMNAGPKSAQEWQYLKGGLISTGPRFRWRLFGNSLRLHPVPSGAFNVVFEYVSNLWVIATGGTTPTKSAFSADTDTCIYPDDVTVLGLKFHWYKTKGLDYAVVLAEFDGALSKAKAHDPGMRLMSMAPRQTQPFIGPGSIPETGYGS